MEIYEPQLSCMFFVLMKIVISCYFLFFLHIRLQSILFVVQYIVELEVVVWNKSRTIKADMCGIYEAYNI